MSPRQPHPHQPADTWTPQEKWVWKRIRTGQKADFNTADCYGGELHPRKAHDWPMTRVLRSDFLETILLREPYSTQLTRHGARIIGAWFTEPLDLSHARLKTQVWLRRCRFNSGVDLSYLATTSLLAIDGSKFCRPVDMTAVQIDQHLFMYGAAEFAAVTLLGAKVGGQINMDGSTFGTLNMEMAQVGHDLFMREKAEFVDVNLMGSSIGGLLSMDGSTFGTLNMNGVHVGQGLHMRDGAEFDEVNLRGAMIKWQLWMDNSRFGTLTLAGVEVDRDLFMRHAEVTRQNYVNLTFTKIDGNLDISGSRLPSLDLSGTRILGEFRLGSGTHFPVMWNSGANLILRNTAVAALQDREDSWKGISGLELDGFTYGRLGGYGADTASDMTDRKASWFIDEWLEKQHRYSPQPYEQLASILRKAGYSTKADDILFARWERERKEKSQHWRRVFLTLQKLFVGYGYRNYYTLWWLVIFTILGTIVLCASMSDARAVRTCYANASWQDSPFPLLLYSFDKFLPLIRLTDCHYTKVDFSDLMVVAYFHFHTLMGYILTSFLFSGLTGIGRKET